MEKLPVIFVSCNAANISAAGQIGAGPARMTQGKSVTGVILMSVVDERADDRDVEISGRGHTFDATIQRLEQANVSVHMSEGSRSDRERLLRALIGELPAELVDVRLVRGMEESLYRRVGVALESLRREGGLVVCLDDRSEPTSGVMDSLNDEELREAVNGWVRDCQWESVMSFRSKSDGGTVRLTDPRICLLKAAFFLGGSTFPQRMFNSGLNSVEHSMFGFGWTR
ncbi:hypothetical protein [Marinobacter sp.]|uniref:hypothetical protein n=1 Tax=Marinobacter sp. TaxID=50741 RepID=UPI0035C7417F